MSLNTYEPKILSGPFGSLLAQHHNVSTQQAFREERTDIIRAALRAYRDAGVTAPVLPTFGAGARDLNDRKFTPELRAWITAAAYLTHETFPKSDPFGSVATLLDTSDHRNEAWRQTHHQSDVARRTHVPTFEALVDGRTNRVLAEAVHDCHEAIGLVLAGMETGMKEVVVSFEPTEQGLPNHADGFGSYGDVRDYLYEIADGKVDVGIALNCGNANQILQIVTREKPGTFRAVYPNKAIIPHGEEGDRFRQLADKNAERTTAEQQEFDALCRIYDVSSQLQTMVALCEKKGVANIGLCCGSGPEDVARLRGLVTTHSSSPQSPLAESLDPRIRYPHPSAVRAPSV